MQFCYFYQKNCPQVKIMLLGKKCLNSSDFYKSIFITMCIPLFYAFVCTDSPPGLLSVLATFLSSLIPRHGTSLNYINININIFIWAIKKQTIYIVIELKIIYMVIQIKRNNNYEYTILKQTIIMNIQL